MDPYTQFVDFATNTVRHPAVVGVRRGTRRVRRRTPQTGSRLSGLGASVPGELSAASGLVAAGSALAAPLGLVAATSAVPVVGAAIAAGIGVAAALGVGQGCGNACVDAAQQEQVYEAAGDNIAAVAKAGMIPGTVAAQMIQQLAAMAQQAEASQGTKQSTSGASNAVSDLQKQASNMAALGSGISQPLNLSAVSSLFIPINQSGWYPQATSAAQQLALQLLESYASSAPSTTTATGSGTSTATSAAGGPQAIATIPTTTGTVGGLSTSTLLLLGAGLLVLVMVM